jgi:hypothetical protein
MMKMTLLTTGNPKIAKGEKLGYLTNILHLAPANLSGYNVCPAASAACVIACLNTAGRGGMFRKGETTNVIQLARIARTKWFFEDRPTFLAKLVREITNAIKLAKKNNLIPVFRLNGTSDIRWETVKLNGKTIFEMFSDIQFYDYSKIVNRRDIPANYDLTFSLSESNQDAAIIALENGMNVAAVFRKMPETFLGYDVINGDDNDLRFLDRKTVIVGLKAKGKAKKDTSGFVQN